MDSKKIWWNSKSTIHRLAQCLLAGPDQRKPFNLLQLRQRLSHGQPLLAVNHLGERFLLIRNNKLDIQCHWLAPVKRQTLVVADTDTRLLISAQS